MKLSEISFDKVLYLFELDDVLFSRRDYLLQVYYLFGSFYEFTEGAARASDMAEFMKKVYDYHGEEAVFPAAKLMFGIDDKYEVNLQRLQANAQLPLKLILPEAQADLLVRLVGEKKQVAVLTKGNPVEQLNKLKFLQWGKADSIKHLLKVFFVDELEFKSLVPIDYIASEYGIDKEDVVFVDEGI
ncbi:HAD family hydrolase [Sphingobacterium faecale]|uniref:HAD family hydrolase n=1 Tax=Sphingobacterium faecale TaxID=2803775 RepID=A0ABS1R9D8_9SPHI|nr:HAD family hydrolase [Sphingobacterium faecale]MBL1411335.1 HAD family hydrolase [Sphingobacterium faecale]